MAARFETEQATGYPFQILLIELLLTKYAHYIFVIRIYWRKDAKWKLDQHQ
jgi:hypothetical protein